jgi:antitoxin MazE
MEGVIRKWGNSPALRLPKALLEQMGWGLEQKLDLVVADGKLILQPAARVSYALDDLLGEMSEDNLHDEVDFGGVAGKELF